MTRVYTLKRIRKKRSRKAPDKIKLNSDTTIQETLEPAILLRSDPTLVDRMREKNNESSSKIRD